MISISNQGRHRPKAFASYFKHLNQLIPRLPVHHPWRGKLRPRQPSLSICFAL
jgi:hypothetical protein